MIESMECCVQCEEPKFPQHQQTCGEKPLGWPGCINPSCIAYGEQQSSVSFKPAEEVSLLLQKKLNALRQFILDEGYNFIK